MPKWFSPSRAAQSPFILTVGLLLAVVFASMLGLFGTDSGHAQLAGSRKTSARVTGTLFLQSSPALRSQPAIELPDIKVTLRSNGADVASSITLLNGKFSLVAPTRGRYQLCWSGPALQGCTKVFAAGHRPHYLGRVGVTTSRPLLFGQVLTGDKRPCWANDSFFGLDFATIVSGAGRKVRANTNGYYALTDLPVNKFAVTAKCEKSNATALVTLGNGFAQRNLSFANRAPQLAAISASDGTKAVLAMAVSDSVRIESTARDPDSDDIEFIWKAIDGSTNIDDSRVSATNFKSSPQPGMQSAYLLARDGKGGYNFKRFDIRVGEASIAFSGTAIDEVTRLPVANAGIEVAGATTKTDARGWFQITAAPASDSRYALSVRHRDYATTARVYDRSSRGGVYELIRTQVNSFTPGAPVRIVDTQSSGLCGKTAETRPKPIRRLAALRFDTSGTARPLQAAEAKRAIAAYTTAQRENDECRKSGAGIQIKPGALVRADGRPVQGAIRASVATLNPSRRALPGDYRAIQADDSRAELLSYGAVFAEFTDAAGNKLNLKPGEEAEIRIPVTALNPASVKPSIAMWSYDEAKGNWIEEGEAVLQTSPQGLVYVGKTRHFSTINMDVAGTNPDFATCVRLELSNDFSGWSDLTLRAYVSYGGDSVQVKEVLLDTAQYHAIYRIPYDGPGGAINTLRLELRGTANGEQRVLLDNIIDTDARPKMTGNDLWPPYDYSACGDPYVLSAAAGVVPPYGDLDATGRPAFLSGPFGDFSPANGAQIFADYYAAIDPGSAKTTLGDWWVANGFDANGGDNGNASYRRQAYLNHNDLGFGRDMNCLKNGANLACYVTNYGLPDQNPQNADDAESRNVATRGATVTMEYDAAAANPDEAVQFYVFGGGVAASARIGFADLDGLGPKPVPLLCSVCHGGGSSLNANNKVEYARFREFDLPSFRYSGNRDWDFGSNNLNATELNNFAKLNQYVRDSTSGTAIAALINAWYGSGASLSGAPALPTPPSGWASQTTGYHEVYGKTCRTCHLARDEGDINNFYVFNSFNFFSGTSYAVCGVGSPKVRFMPNASITYRNFWADTPRVAQFETLMGVPAGTCDD